MTKRKLCLIINTKVESATLKKKPKTTYFQNEEDTYFKNIKSPNLKYKINYKKINKYLESIKILDEDMEVENLGSANITLDDNV